MVEDDLERALELLRGNSSTLIIYCSNVDQTVQKIKQWLRNQKPKMAATLLQPGNIDTIWVGNSKNYIKRWFQDDYPRDISGLLALHYLNELSQSISSKMDQLVIWQEFSSSTRLEQELSINMQRFQFTSEKIVKCATVFVEKQSNDFIRKLKQELYDLNPNYLPVELTLDSHADSPVGQSQKKMKLVVERSGLDDWKRAVTLLEQGKLVSGIIAQYAIANRLVEHPQPLMIGKEHTTIALELVTTMIRYREHVLALRLIEKFQVAAGSADATLFQANLNFQAARAYRYLGKLDNARECLAKIDSGDQSHANPMFYKELTSLKLTVAYHQGQYALLDEALSIENNDRQVVHPPDVQLHILYGHRLFSAGKQSDALREYEIALKLAKKLDYKIGQANALQSLAIIARSGNQLPQAIELFKHAASQFTDCGHFVGALAAQMNLAICYFQALETGKALWLFEQCERGWQRWQEPRELAETLLHYGKTLHFIGRRYEGLEKIRFARWLAENQKLHSIVGEASLTITCAEIGAGNMIDAKLSLTQAQSLTNQVDTNLNQKITVTRDLLQLIDNDSSSIAIAPWMSKLNSVSEPFKAELLVLAMSHSKNSVMDPGLVQELKKLTDHAHPMVRWDAFRALSADPNIATGFEKMLATASQTLPEAMRTQFMQVARSPLRRGLPTTDPRKTHTPMTAMAGGIIQESPVMQQLISEVKRVATSNTTVLLTGETGSGKEMIAQELHRQSPLSDKPLVTVSCAAIPSNLFEAQFFGYLKGAFTGAHKNQKGYFEEADGGTLFLDNIDELPLENQAKLLRVLQENEIRQVGSTQNRKIQVRLIAASQTPLRKLVESGQFRLDLFYRLDIIALEIPPLRDRHEDIAPLIDYYLRKHNATNITFSDEAMQALLKYHWPGNVRELFNEVAKQFTLMRPSAVVELSHLSPQVRGGGDWAASLIARLYGLILRDGHEAIMQQLERGIIEKFMRNGGGKIQTTAKLMKLPRITLRDRLRKHGLI